MLATRSGAAVAPITIRGSREILTPKSYHVRSGDVVVTIGKPIATEGKSTAELAKLVRDEIVTTYEKTLDRYSHAVSSEI